MSVWWILRTYEREPACRFCNRPVRFLSMRGCCNLVYLDDLGPFRDRVVMNGYTSWVPRRAFITLLRFGANVLLLRGWIQLPADRFRDLCYSAAFFFFSVCACVCETPLSPETCGVFFWRFCPCCSIFCEHSTKQHVFKFVNVRRVRKWVQFGSVIGEGQTKNLYMA